jgi:AhpD family alkylhydroperoxidase
MRIPYDILAAEGLRALGSVYSYILKCELEKPLIDLVFLRSSQINGCAFCIDAHARDAIAGGASIDQLMLVSAWREAGDLFTDRERAGLAWAEVVTAIAETHASDDDFQAARQAFSEKELADLTLAIGIINTYNRLAISFRKEPAVLKKIRAAS